MKIRSRTIISILVVLAIIAAAIMFFEVRTNRAGASASDNVHGWLWSDMPEGSDECLHGLGVVGSILYSGCSPHTTDATNNGGSGNFVGRGLGWISLNNVDACTPGQGQPCFGAAYGVKLDLATGVFTGHGWSEWGGWLEFNPSGTSPSGPGTTAGPARIDPTCLSGIIQSCPVKGWMKFSVGPSGGWDGWVSLGGTGYSVMYNKVTKKITGNAWGDWVAGWVRFHDVTVTVTPPVPPTTCVDANGTVYTYTPPNYPNQCVQNVCYSQPGNVPHYYAFGAPTPGICTPQVTPPNPNICNNQNAYNFGQPGVCTYNFCPLIKIPPGPISQAQISGNGYQLQPSGVWYGLSNGQCISSVCPNYTDKFYATPPSGEIIYHGECISVNSPDVCKLNPELCVGGVIKPIYKEN